MKDFFKGFIDYLKNWWEGIVLVGIYMAILIVVILYVIVSGITGKSNVLITSRMSVDFFQGITDTVKKSREKKIDKAIAELEKEETK